MNPPTLGEGDGDTRSGRSAYDTESPTLARTSPSESASNDSGTLLPVLQRGAASTELARVAPAVVEPPHGETAADGSSRSGTVVTGELQLAVNAPDGSTATECPPGALPQPVPAPADPTVRPRSTSGLLERDALCERLRGQMLQGRSVRLVGPRGSGRSAILDAVATACSGLAPAGVVRLTGYARTSGDLLQDLFSATHRNPGYRPGRALLPELLRDLCAIVVIDDVEFSGEPLEELLAVAPESSFLITSATAVATPLNSGHPGGARLEDTRLPGLSRQSSLALLARLAGRSLDETERAWAVDLWFESEGLPLRFVQAAALLRHRESAIEAMAAGLPGPEWSGPAAIGSGPVGAGSGAELVPVREPAPGGFEAYLRQHGRDEDAPLPDPVPLPSVAESAAPAVRIARGLSEGARRTLRLATALGGECPSAPHLPALIDVGHGEEALAELVGAGLAAPVGSRHHRLVGGVTELLVAEWPTGDAARDAAQHFAWWTGHASVTEEQIAAEAEVLLAVMHADREQGRHQQVVLLARASAPAFALALRWGAWERALRFGLESARATAAVGEEAWFHHELGVLALCVGAHDRSRAELEASVALRGALGDSRGTASGRRALRQLDRVGALLPGRPVLIGARGAGRGGLRRVLPFNRVDDARATRRQILLAGAGVLLMGLLGAGIALGVGAFQNVGAGAGLTVSPTVGAGGPSMTDPAPSGTGPGGGAPVGSSPSATGAASTTAAPTHTAGGPGGPGQQTPGDPGHSPSSPGLTPSPTSTHTQGSPTPKPTHTTSSPAAPSTPPSTSTTPSPSTSSTTSSAPVTTTGALATTSGPPQLALGTG